MTVKISVNFDKFDKKELPIKAYNEFLSSNNLNDQIERYK